MRGKPLSPEQVERRRQTPRDLDLGQYLEIAHRKRAWPEEHLPLLGTVPDSELARRIGRTPMAVSCKRCVKKKMMGWPFGGNYFREYTRAGGLEDA